MNVTDQLAGLHDTDQENYDKISAAFPDERALINELLAVYDACASALRTPLKKEAHFVAFCFICGLCRKHLLLGVVQASRCIDCSEHARR